MAVDIFIMVLAAYGLTILLDDFIFRPLARRYRDRLRRKAWKSHDLDTIDSSDEVLWDREWDKVLDEQPAVRHGMAARAALGNDKRGCA